MAQHTNETTVQTSGGALDPIEWDTLFNRHAALADAVERPFPIQVDEPAAAFPVFMTGPVLEDFLETLAVAKALRSMRSFYELLHGMS